MRARPTQADSADDDGDDEEEAEEDVATYRRKAINKKGPSGARSAASAP
jgi:hypothetical protein